MDTMASKAVWTCEPTYEPPFPAEQKTLEEFLEYLAKKSKVKVIVECHSLTRNAKDGYSVKNTERVGFRLKDRALCDALCQCGLCFVSS